LCVHVLVGIFLSILDCPTSPSKMEYMSGVPYNREIGSLMYDMVFLDQTFPKQWEFFPNICQILVEFIDM
jgi:hypothetical protein